MVLVTLLVLGGGCLQGEVHAFGSATLPQPPSGPSTPTLPHLAAAEMTLGMRTLGMRTLVFLGLTK